MNILITGATGFIGKHLIPSLLQRGWNVRCLARPTSQLPKEFIDQVEWVIVNLEDRSSLIKACANVDAVIHLGGAIKARNADTFYVVNVEGTRNLFSALEQSGKSNARFIYVSSQAAIGPAPTPEPLTEVHPPRPVSNYGKSKLEAEKIILEYSDRIQSVILRPVVVYGPGDRESLAFFKMAKYHLNPRLGIQPQYINLIYVRDLIEIICLGLEKDINSGEIFHVNDGNSAGYRVSEVINCAARLLDTWTLPVFIPKQILKTFAILNSYTSKLLGYTSIYNPDKYYELSEPYWICSSEKVQTLIGYTPEYDMLKGFSITAKWYKEHQWL
jgi:nucleoside-diphosphate-sugar epimerase